MSIRESNSLIMSHLQGIEQNKQNIKYVDLELALYTVVTF